MSEPKPEHKVTLNSTKAPEIPEGVTIVVDNNGKLIEVEAPEGLPVRIIQRST